MRGRMPVNFQRLWILVGKQAEIGIFLQRLGEIDQVAVTFRYQRGIRQPRADGLGNVKRGRALGNFLHTPIRELHMNTVCHRVETCKGTESFSLWQAFGRVKPDLNNFSTASLL